MREEKLVEVLVLSGVEVAVWAEIYNGEKKIKERNNAISAVRVNA